MPLSRFPFFEAKGDTRCSTQFLGPIHNECGQLFITLKKRLRIKSWYFWMFKKDEEIWKKSQHNGKSAIFSIFFFFNCQIAFYYYIFEKISVEICFQFSSEIDEIFFVCYSFYNKYEYGNRIKNLRMVS